MDATDLFASEWQNLQEQRQRIVNEAEQLKRRLNSLTEEPSLKKLLKEKKRLIQSVPNLTGMVEMHQGFIEGRAHKLEKRRRALTDKHIQQELATQLRNRRHRLAQFKKLNAPAPFVENERRMVFELEAPIEEVEKLYQQMNVEDEQKRDEAQQLLEETLANIAAGDACYRKARCCLEDGIREVERKRHECRTEEIEWATQSREHLEWILEHHPSYREDVIRRYRIRFPSDNLDGLIPEPMLIPVQVHNLPKSRRKRNNSHPLTTPTTAASAPQVWRFFVTFNSGDLGLELSQEHDSFLRELQAALHRAAYHSLNVQLVYDKLLAVTRMSVQQRQEMNKVAENELAGWKILRVGKKHRLFLSIDEDKCSIRFLPCPRKKSYLHH